VPKSRFHIQQAAQIRAYRAAWKEAGHARAPRVSVSRSIVAIMDDRDRIYFGRGGDDDDQIGFISPETEAIFGRSYAAEPEVLIEQLRTDEAIMEAIAEALALFLTRFDAAMKYLRDQRPIEQELQGKSRGANEKICAAIYSAFPLPNIRSTHAGPPLQTGAQDRVRASQVSATQPRRAATFLYPASSTRIIPGNPASQTNGLAHQISRANATAASAPPN